MRAYAAFAHAALCLHLCIRRLYACVRACVRACLHACACVRVCTIAQGTANICGRYSPLHCAAAAGRMDAMILLLLRGADRDLHDKDG